MRFLLAMTIASEGAGVPSVGHRNSLPSGKMGPVMWETLFPDVRGLHFVQIGANQGTPTNARAGEPIWNYQKAFNWSGAVIEANPRIFDVLVRNYKPFPSVAPLNVAVSDGKQRELDFWCPSLNSTTAEGCTLSKRWAVRLNWMRNMMRVPAVSLRQLWERLKPRRVDILCVDVEGAEYSILSQPLPYPQPAFLYFETTGLTNTAVNGPNGPGKLAALRRYLAKQGYEAVHLGNSEAQGDRDDLWRKRAHYSRQQHSASAGVELPPLDDESSRAAQASTAIFGLFGIVLLAVGLLGLMMMCRLVCPE